MVEETPKSLRASGVLLHPTSLAGPGIGDLGDACLRFIDWLAEAGQTYWQILPLVPVDAGGSPYNGLSALAGNPLLLSPEQLRVEGVLDESLLARNPPPSGERVDYPAVARWKEELLVAAHRRFVGGAAEHLRSPFDEFRRASESWLGDYSLFRALRAHHRGASWLTWPVEIRERRPAAIAVWSERLAVETESFDFQQFLFALQWERVHTHARSRGVRIIGDIPIFVAHDSADVWANPDLFQLTETGRPTVVAGVPPDYFSETGQRWGNPLYRWGDLRERGYDWWIERFRRTLELVDVVRIDHFRGFEAYWEIPADAPTAVEGRWVDGPGADFFEAVESRLGKLPLIAEDLGLITPQVEALRDELGLPGMRVIQFGFDGNPENPHRPDNYVPDSVAYTGTHDNDTLIGWWAGIGEEERQRVRDWLRNDHPQPWDIIEALFRSRSNLAIVPLQDLLGLGNVARMNTPGEAADNWTWRVTEAPGPRLAERLRQLTESCHRLGLR